MGEINGFSVVLTPTGKPHEHGVRGTNKRQLVAYQLTNLLGWWQIFGLASPMLLFLGQSVYKSRASHGLVTFLIELYITHPMTATANPDTFPLGAEQRQE